VLSMGQAVFANRNAFAEELIDCSGISKLPVTEAERMLEAVQKSYRATQTLKAQFLQDSFSAALELREKSSGTVTFQNPGKMRWDYSVPEQQTFLFVEGTIWFYQPELRQVLIDRAQTMLLTDVPLAFLLGVGDIKRDFSIVHGCRREEGIVLHLTPRTNGDGVKDEAPRTTLKEFWLMIDSTRSLPIGARIVDSGGNVTSVLLRDLATNDTLMGELFRPEFPKGTDIQDRRELGG
jgi:outer membrane lipoprotein-sorting protein